MSTIQLTEKSLCPCTSTKTFGECCARFLSRKAKPKTAEELLRSRYTAFVVADIDYVVETHHSKTVKDVNRKELEEWAQDSDWISLKVMEKEAGEANDEKGTIVFHAQYDMDGKHNDHFEKSFFEKENGDWKFLDAHGIQTGPYVREEPKTGRNDPCPCGSGKKYKKCHAA